MMKNEKGFTLIEMLIVLAVISILLILLVPNLADRNKDIHAKSEETMVQMAENQTQAYFIDHGQYPESIQALVAADYLSTDLVANKTKRLIYEDTLNYRVTTEDVD
ncbi:competence protein ComGC [Pelagirhabdus alkalitolerans]|uniref:ComG operon protein 3 n=1 Tax=Pelagirhabdus alkalitolerans TaxID=1612202 RepID=A0A1G6HZ32_9BACI|nr:competence type IV pilus major pilin ComGC [Pelagirhabdus alkalitolerans]SDB99464.1 competence protein ComGC [Pelagirhabdus alkalitolerans]